MTRAQHHLGEVGSGAIVKLALDTMIAVTNESVSELLVLCERAGLERAATYAALADSALASPFVQYKQAAFLAPDDAAVAFTPLLMLKDLALAEALAAEVGAELPAVVAARAVLERTVAAGQGDGDLVRVADTLRGAPHERRRDRDAAPLRRDGGGHDRPLAQGRGRPGRGRRRARRGRDRQGDRDLRGRDRRAALGDPRPGGRGPAARRADRPGRRHAGATRPAAATAAPAGGGRLRSRPGARGAGAQRRRACVPGHARGAQARERAGRRSRGAAAERVSAGASASPTWRRPPAGAATPAPPASAARRRSAPPPAPSSAGAAAASACRSPPPSA